MSRDPINHPAFPVPAYAGDSSNGPVRPNSGMGIRDYFATAALTALASEKSAGEPEVVAELAYAFADAMLEERQYANRK
jgi:hypothetical protein